MKLRDVVSESDRVLEAVQVLVDAVAAAVDQDRVDEVARVREALEAFGLGQAFTDEGSDSPATDHDHHTPLGR